MMDELKGIVRRARDKRPMVHAITNNVTVNDCANIILAAYGAPTMAQDPREVEEITALCDALVLNLGAWGAQQAMLLAGKRANALGHPIVLDPVAAGASFLRGETSRKLLHSLDIAVLRGNASEIRALAVGSETTQGVEANALDYITEDNLAASAAMVQDLSRRTGAAVVVSGAIDLVADGVRAVALRGGSAMMRRITGAGCMLTSLTAVYCGGSPGQPFAAAVAAAAVMNACAQIAEARVQAQGEGTASFRTRLIDAVSLFDENQLDRYLQLQVL